MSEYEQGVARPLIKHKAANGDGWIVWNWDFGRWDRMQVPPEPKLDYQPVEKST